MAIDGIERGIVKHHGDDDIAGLAQGSRRRRNVCSEARQRLRLGKTSVPDSDLVAAGDEALRDCRAHFARSAHSDLHVSTSFVIRSDLATGADNSTAAAPSFLSVT